MNNELTSKQMVNKDGEVIERISNIPRHKRKGGKPTPLLIITNQWLANYFNVSIRTIHYWKKQKLFNPTDIDSIYEYKKSRLSKTLSF
jgi:hypothetical protein